MELQESLGLEVELRHLLGKEDERYSDLIGLNPCQTLGRAMFEMLFQDSHSFTAAEKAKILFAGLTCANAAINKNIDENAESIAIKEASDLLDELTNRE